MLTILSKRLVMKNEVKHLVVVFYLFIFIFLIAMNLKIYGEVICCLLTWIPFIIDESIEVAFHEISVWTAERH